MRAISAPTKRPGDAGPTFASAESKIEVGQYLKAWRRTQSQSNLSPPCILGKCREILTKCREAIIATRLEADVSQEVGCDSPYARSREVNLR
jgi:hypothetical protein